MRPCSIVIAWLLTLANCALAQSNVPAPPPDASIYSSVFSKTTNNNGYEEFVRACDLVKGVDGIEAASDPGATLELMRHVMGQPECSEALDLVREGLKKPVLSPRATISPDTRLVELAQFRKLARLFYCEVYVDFAEGRGDAAVASLETGLSFGYRIQTDTVVSGLVGIACDAIVMKEFSAHMGQLSIYQCDEVVSFCRQLLAADNPGPRLIELEKQHTIQSLEQRRNDPSAILDLFNGIDSSQSEDAASFAALRRNLQDSPGTLNSIIDTAEARISALYDQTAANMTLPPSQRVPLNTDAGNTPGGALFSLMALNPQPMVDRYAAEGARVRLLAAEALIQNYKWHHHALPPSLAALHAEDIVVDPFTGESLKYRIDGDRYSLSSVGPFKNDDNGKPTAQRSPVTLQ